MPLLKFPEPFRSSFIGHYISVGDEDQNVVNELISQYFAAIFDPEAEPTVLLDTLKTLLAIKLAADEFRRTNRHVPAEALVLLTMAGERPCMSPLHH
jgi:hypothetical protein